MVWNTNQIRGMPRSQFANLASRLRKPCQRLGQKKNSHWQEPLSAFRYPVASQQVGRIRYPVASQQIGRMSPRLHLAS